MHLVRVFAFTAHVSDLGAATTLMAAALYQITYLIFIKTHIVILLQLVEPVEAGFRVENILQLTCNLITLQIFMQC